MHKKLDTLIFTLAVFLISGCSNAINKSLSPPADTKWVKIEIKNPSPYTSPFPLNVRYISQKCLKKRVSGFDGSVITEPSYNVIQTPLQEQSGDIWKAQIAITGGGSCQWTLSAVTLGIEYIDATHLGKDLEPGSAAGAIIAFDNDASRNGQFTSSQGNLILTPKYYPYISEWNLGEKKKELSLLGKKSFLSLRAFDLSEVSFLPTIDETKIVRYIGIEKKIKGARSKIIYPDGSINSNGEIFPSFEKVDGARVK